MFLYPLIPGNPKGNPKNKYFLFFVYNCLYYSVMKFKKICLGCKYRIVLWKYKDKKLNWNGNVVIVVVSCWRTNPFVCLYFEHTKGFVR